MTYLRTGFAFGPQHWSQLQGEFASKWTETIRDAQSVFMPATQPRDIQSAISSQLAFGRRNMERWFGWQTVIADTAAKESPQAPASRAAAANTQAIEAEFTVEEPPHAAAPSLADDDLQRIRGIGPTLAGKLAARGVTRFTQLAALDAMAVEELDAALNLKGRIERDSWVQQAAELAAQA